MRPIQAIAISLALATAAARAGAAQAVEGRLLGAGGAPAPAARMQLVAADSEVVADDVTAADGSFSLVAPDTGSYRIRATPLGGEGIFFGPVRVAAGAPASVVLHLPRAGEANGDVTLAPVTAVARAQLPVLERRGFYQRQHVHYGRFLTQDDIRQPGRTLLDQVQRLGILVEANGGRRFSLYRMKRGARCYVAVFVDGQQAPNQVLTSLTTDEVAGIEYYRDADIPTEFNPYWATGWDCGTVVIWTDHGYETR